MSMSLAAFINMAVYDFCSPVAFCAPSSTMKDSQQRGISQFHTRLISPSPVTIKCMCLQQRGLMIMVWWLAEGSDNSLHCLFVCGGVALCDPPDQLRGRYPELFSLDLFLYSMLFLSTSFAISHKFGLAFFHLKYLRVLWASW